MEKTTHRYCLQQLLRQALIMSEREREFARYEILFSDEFYSFQDNSESKTRVFLKKDDIFNIIDFFKQRHSKHRLRDYLIFSTLAFSGCRLKPMRLLKVKNIDIKSGSFRSLDKSRGGHQFSTYFLPVPFLKEINEYIRLKHLNSDDLLFSVKNRQVLRLIKLVNCEYHPHLLRDAFNSRLALAGCPEFIRTRLLNQKSKSTNIASYTRVLDDPKNLYVAYMRFFPYKKFYPGYDWDPWQRDFLDLIDL